MTMPRLTVGDLAQANLMKLGQTRLKADLTRLAEELTTGLRTDLNPKLGGDLTPLAALERARSAVTPWQGASTEAGTALDTAQTALETFQSIASTLALEALDVMGQGTETDISRLAEEAMEEFDRLASVLNTGAAGRSLFAGTATDGPAILTGETILAQIASDATNSGAVTTDDYIAVIDAYFATGGGFDTIAYQGDAAADGIRVSADDTVSALPTAQDDRIRATLRAAALGALAGDESLGLTATDRETLINAMGEDLLAADAGLVDLRSSVGRAQEQVEIASSRLSAEAYALDQSILELTAADPYETASALEETQLQLETLYAVQARLSTMGLAGYL